MRDLIPQPEVPEPAPLRAPPVVQKHRFLSRPIILLAAALVGLVAVGLVGIEQWQRPQRSAMPELPRVQVERFEVQGDAAAGADIAKGTQQEIITRLSRFRDLSVLAPVDEGAGNPATLSRYVLGGSVIPTSKGFRLRTSLVQRPDGAVLWSDTYDSDLTNTSLVQAQAEIADKVAMQLGQSYGVLVLADKEFKRTLSPEDWAAYSCVLSFNFLRAKLDAAMIPNLKECLEQTVRRFPDYSTAWALLSLNRIDELRSVFPNDPAASRAMLERAFSDARKAAALDPQNARALQAEMLALFWDKQFAQGQIIGDRALALNPNDTNLLAEYGYRLALFGDWPKGCAMLRKAFQQDQITMMYYNPGLSLCSYFEGNLADAVAQIRKTAATSHPLHLMVAAAIHAEAGNLVEADRFRTLLLSSSPALARNLRQEVSLRLGRPEDVEKFLTSLGKAGLT